jgi:hypothetical protein
MVFENSTPIAVDTGRRPIINEVKDVSAVLQKSKETFVFYDFG